MSTDFVIFKKNMLGGCKMFFFFFFLMMFYGVFTWKTPFYVLASEFGSNGLFLSGGRASHQRNHGDSTMWPGEIGWV